MGKLEETTARNVLRRKRLRRTIFFVAVAFGLLFQVGILLCGMVVVRGWMQTRHERPAVAALQALGADFVFSPSGHVVSLEANIDELGDDDLAHVAKLRNLTRLELAGSAITDDGLKHLYGMKRLEQLFVWNTAISSDSVRKLEKELPRCRVFSRWSLPHDLAHLAYKNSIGVDSESITAGDEANDAFETIVGTWEAIQCTQDGAPWPEKFIGVRYTFDTSMLRIDNPNGSHNESRYRVSWISQPHEIDVFFPLGPPLQGIFSIDGDTMQYCWGALGRPKGFESNDGDRHTLLLLQRIAP